MEYKEKGLVSHSLAIMQKHDVLNKCILFSGENDVIAEMQEWFRQNGRPSGLWLGANFRFLSGYAITKERLLCRVFLSLCSILRAQLVVCFFDQNGTKGCTDQDGNDRKCQDLTSA